jgi:hypothetical protein
LSMTKSPPIEEGPLSEISPVAPEPMTTLPEMVEQAVYAAASACELMVAVGWEQIVALWAGKTIELASFYAN